MGPVRNVKSLGPNIDGSSQNSILNDRRLTVAVLAVREVNLRCCHLGFQTTLPSSVALAVPRFCVNIHCFVSGGFDGLCRCCYAV